MLFGQSPLKEYFCAAISVRLIKVLGLAIHTATQGLLRSSVLHCHTVTLDRWQSVITSSFCFDLQIQDTNINTSLV
jgi:hypothetical protein